jgi:XTP/dITP diphosphohydrolase
MLYFVTENKPKFDNANILLKKHGIQVKQKKLPLLEIQTDSLEEIALYKARQAFEKVKKPLIVKDDGWYITALKGFPSVYMKYVNQWLGPEDFLRLIKPYRNREIIFKEALCYIDDKKHKVFLNSIPGKIVKKPKGEAVASAMISTFRKDDKTMAECINEEIHFSDSEKSAWHDFVQWYKKYPKQK